MIRKLLHRAIRRQARACGIPLEHLHRVVETSPLAFGKLLLFAPLAAHRGALTPTQVHTARLAAVGAHGCAACVRITAWVAERDGFTGGSGGTQSPGEARLRDTIADFAREIAAGRDAPELRDRLRTQLGERGLVEIALVVAASGVFPTLKRALGCGASCSLEQPPGDAFAVSGPRHRFSGRAG